MGFLRHPSWDIPAARAALLVALFLFSAGRISLWLSRPPVPEGAGPPGDWNWPPPVSKRIVDASLIPPNRLLVFPPGTTVREGLLSMGLTPDPTGSGFVLPRAGVVKRQADGWTVVAMSQRERFIWAIPMELTSSEEADFIRIPGIGPVLATRLADFISRRVWLASVSELDEVPGVGSAKLRVLSEYLEVE